MHKIGVDTSTAEPITGEWTEGGPGGTPPATIGKSAWLNSVQRELVGVVEKSGRTLSASNDLQLAASLPLTVDGMANLRTLPPIAGHYRYRTYHTTPGDSGYLMFHGKTGAAPGTYVDNNGNIAVNGDGSAAWLGVDSGIVRPREFGAKGDGIANDTVACQAAATAALNKTLDFGEGVYLVDSLTGTSNTIWRGAGAGVCTIKARGALTNDFILFSSKNRIAIHNLSIDYNNVATTGTLSALGFLLCSDFKVKNCEITRFVKLGLGINAGTRFQVEGNRITKDVMSTTLNQSILITNATGQSSKGWVRKNICINSGIIAQGSFLHFHENEISGWGYGAGISTGQDTVLSNIVVITKNIIFSSNSALDADGLPPQGIENWSRHSKIIGNTVYSCAGSGIFNGAKDSIINDNDCFDNGTYVAVGNNGISLSYFNATYNANGSVVVGNRCFDRSGAAGTQVYGIAASSLLTQLSVGVNHVEGNKTSGYSIPSSGVEFHGRNLTHTFSYDFPSIPGPGGIADNVQTVGGAEIGDYVQISCSVNLQRLTATAYVNAANAVTIVMANNTAAAIDLPLATYRLLIAKPHK